MTTTTLSLLHCECYHLTAIPSSRLSPKWRSFWDLHLGAQGVSIVDTQHRDAAMIRCRRPRRTRSRASFPRSSSPSSSSSSPLFVSSFRGTTGNPNRYRRVHVQPSKVREGSTEGKAPAHRAMISSLAPSRTPPQGVTLL